MAIMYQMETVKSMGIFLVDVNRVTPQMRLGSQHTKKITLIIRNLHFSVAFMLRSAPVYWKGR